MELRHYVALLWRRKALVLCCLVVAGLTAGFAHQSREPVYSSTAQLLLLPNDPSERVSDAPSTPFDARRYAAAQVTVLLSQDVARRAAAGLPDITAAELRQALTVEPVPDSDVITITATHPSPEQAAAVANATAEAYIEQRRESDVQALQLAAEQIGQQLDLLQARLTELRRQAGSNPGAAVEADLAAANVQYSTLFARQQDLLVDSSLKRGEAQLVDPALAPSSPDGLSLPTAVVLGLLLGGLLGLGLAWLREQLDDRVRLREELEQLTGLPVLAELPIDVPASRNPDHVVTETDPHSPVAEALRSLRTSVSFLGIEEPIRRVLVTSAVPGDGKTFVAANLAAAFAQAGQRTVVVSADLRRPRLEQYFGIPAATTGLTTVLALSRHAAAVTGGDEADEVRHHLSSVLLLTGTDGLVVLPSGPVPPNPAEILTSSRMDAVLDVLSEDFDMIVVDTSPVLAVTDAAALAGKVGSVLVVAGARTSRRRELDRMMAVLERTPARVLGFVLNRSSASKVLSYAPAVPAYEDEDEDEAPVEPRYEAPAARHPTARVDLLPSAEVVQHPGASFGRSGPGPAADDPGPSVPWEEPGHAVLLAPEPEQPASLTPDPEQPASLAPEPEQPASLAPEPEQPASLAPEPEPPAFLAPEPEQPGSPESDPVLPERTAAWDPLFEPYAAEDPSSNDHVLPPVQAPAGGWPAPGSAEPDPPVHAEPPRSTDVALADPAVPALTPTDLVPPSPPRRHLGADSLGWVDTVLGRGWLPASGRSGDRHQESAAERGATAPPDGDAAPEQAQAGDWRSTGTGWADRTG